MREASSLVFVGATSEEPVQLSGPPLRLAGQVRLRNPHAVSLVLRDLAISDRSGRLGDMPARHAFPPIVLRPAEERAVTLAIALDPGTPPGEYHVELNITGQVRPAVLNVGESVALSVEPKRIVVTNEPERPRRTHLVMTNEGNVPLTIGNIGDVDLRDDVTKLRDLRGVVGPMLGEVPEDLDDLVAVVLAIVPPRGPVVGCLSVRTLADPIHLHPGRTAKVDLEIVVPRGLAVHGRYRGRAALLTADLEFVVMSTPLPTRGEPRTTKSPSASRTKYPTGGSSAKHKSIKEGGRR